MAETGLAVPRPARAAGGAVGFLVEALAALRDRALVAPALLLALFLTATNIVLALTIPASRGELLFFIAVALVRVSGVLLFAVAILRILGGSPRRTWAPDAALWLYGATFLFGIGLTLALTRLAGGREGVLAGLAVGAAVSILTAPFAAWFAAIAVERPLAWRAASWLRDFRRWLPPMLLWSLLLVVPLAQLHAAIDSLLVEGAGSRFWPLALFDGPLSALLAFLSLALASAAYRSVAKGGR
jgi:hypothetical protein